MTTPLLVRRFLADYARNPVNLLTLVLVPVVFVLVAAGPLADAAKLLGGAGGGPPVETATAGWAAGFLAGVAMYFQVAAARDTDRRLVVAGMPARPMVAARLLTGLVLAATCSRPPTNPTPHGSCANTPNHAPCPRPRRSTSQPSRRRQLTQNYLELPASMILTRTAVRVTWMILHTGVEPAGKGPDAGARVRREVRESVAPGVWPSPRTGSPHTFVTTMLDAGVEHRDVQIAARHTDPRTTMRYDPPPQQPRPPPQLHPCRLHGLRHLTHEPADERTSRGDQSPVPVLHWGVERARSGDRLAVEAGGPADDHRSSRRQGRGAERIGDGVAARFRPLDPLAGDARPGRSAREGGRGRASAGRDRGCGGPAARHAGDRRVVGRRGMEPRVGLHHACPHAAARPGAGSCERPGAPGGQPCPRQSDVAGRGPA